MRTRKPKNNAPTVGVGMTTAVEIPVRGIGRILCDYGPLRGTLTNLAVDVIGEFRDGSEPDPLIVATKQWAADAIAERAALYFVNVDLPEIAAICSRAALLISLYRAISELDSLLPDDLEDKARREMWGRLGDDVQQIHKTRKAIVKRLTTELLQQLSNLTGRGGAPKKNRADVVAFHRRRLQELKDSGKKDATAKSIAKRETKERFPGPHGPMSERTFHRILGGYPAET